VFNVEDCATLRAPGRLMRRIDKVMRAVVESRFGDHDLSYTHWVALKQVGEGLVTNAGALAREIGITTGATTRMIDTLESQGLMRRDRTGEDRRVVHIALTPEGEATVQRLQGRVVDAWNEAFAGFREPDARRLVAMLVDLLAAAERLLPAAKEIEE
jgi:DNA-binding MarR family transcriptional regulator